MVVVSSSSPTATTSCLPASPPCVDLWQPEYDLREQHQQDDRDHHHHDERPDGPVDVSEPDLGRRHRAHEEQIVAEGRRDVRDLAGDRVKDAEPDEVEAE